MLDFARCPKRSSTCPAPNYCRAACIHAEAWMADQQQDMQEVRERQQPGPIREVQMCDDATADRLEAEGWTIRRDALAADHHGFYTPHLAVREAPDDGPSTWRQIGDVAASVLAKAARKAAE